MLKSPKRVNGSPFAVDWTNKDAVIAYAKKLGSGMTVHLVPSRNNYNVCHTVNRHLYAGSTVIFQT